jgi:uncharacterized protein
MLKPNDHQCANCRVRNADVSDGDSRSAENLIGEVYATAATYFERSRGSHDWDHTLRVLRLAERIGTTESADLLVVRIAALLHDIGRTGQDEANGRLCHAEYGARLAQPLLAKLPLREQQKQNILDSISSHRFRGEKVPDTIEAKVLFDADKLDAIGAVGVARAFLFAGEVGARLHNPDARIEETQPYTVDDTGYREYKVKLRKIKDRMLTNTGRELAEKRHQFMEKFFQRFLQEYNGKG